LAFRPRAPGARHRDGKRMNIVYYLVLLLHVLACLFLIGVVLLIVHLARGRRAVP